MSRSVAAAILWDWKLSEGTTLLLGPEITYRWNDDDVETSDLLGPDQFRERSTGTAGIGEHAAIRRAIGRKVGLQFGVRASVEHSRIRSDDTHYNWWGPSLTIATGLTFAP